MANQSSRERSAGQKASRKLQQSILSESSIFYNNRNSNRLKSSYRIIHTKVKPRMRQGLLNSLTIEAPRHSFIQHYGFKHHQSGKEIPGKEHLSKALDKTKAIEVLATEISEIRGDKVLSNLRFNDGR